MWPLKHHDGFQTAKINKDCRQVAIVILFVISPNIKQNFDMAELREVFGQTRDLPLNYVRRAQVDDQFKNSLNYGKHIVLYGSSKQGKTSLRKSILAEEGDSIVIHCSNKWNISQLNAQILKQAGFVVKSSSEKTIDGRAKASVGFDFAKLFTAGGEGEAGYSQTEQFEPLTLDLQDVNDIIDALESINFDRFVVIEDFHYLRDETQRDFAFALKAYHENSNYIFIIVGVWLEDNRLTLLNGDLVGRVHTINADEWESRDLARVITKGEDLLNIRFEEVTKANIIRLSTGSVFVVQELCLNICIEAGITKTQKSEIIVNSKHEVIYLLEQIINQQTGRYNSFLTSFSLGFQETELSMYRWLLYPVLQHLSSGSKKGLSYREIKESVMKVHPRGKSLNPGNLTLALTSCGNLQAKKQIQPIILDYDQSNLMLNIVDKGFVIWLIFQDKDWLLEKIGLPNDND